MWVSAGLEASGLPIPLRYVLFYIANVDSVGRFYVRPSCKKTDYNKVNWSHEGNNFVWQKNSSDETTTIDSKWAVDSEITNRSSLSEELKNFCPDYPIYRVYTMENASASEKTETDGKRCS